MTEREIARMFKQNQPSVPQGFESRHDLLLLRLTENTGGEVAVKRKLSVGLVLAIVLLLVAFAAVAAVSHWMQQQAELRNILNVEGKNIPEYVEYNPVGAESIAENGLQAVDSGTSADGRININVLSAMKDSEFVRYYISVSPVTLEQAENYSWYVWREGLDGYASAYPVNGDLNIAYNESSQSLMLDFSLMVGWAIDLNETQPFMATLFSEDRRIIAQWPMVNTEDAAFVSVNPETNQPLTREEWCELLRAEAVFTIVPNTSDMATISISFGDGFEFTNPKTSETGLILGVEVNAGNFIWIYSYPGAEKYYAAGTESLYQSKKAAWLNSFDNAIRDAIVVMSDGSSINAPIPVAADYIDGVFRGYARLEFPIDLSTLEDVIICTEKDHDHNHGWDKPKG